MADCRGIGESGDLQYINQAEVLGDDAPAADGFSLLAVQSILRGLREMRHWPRGYLGIWFPSREATGHWSGFIVNSSAIHRGLLSSGLETAARANSSAGSSSPK